MVVEYSRDLSHNYMLIREEGTAVKNSYELNTLMSNRIPGILPMEVERANGAIAFRYDISRCQALSAICMNGLMSAELLRDLYSNLLDSLLALEDYLLDSSHLLVEMDSLCVCVEERALQVPYVPTYSRDIRISLISLTEAVIMQISHGRQDAIVLACRILHELQGEDVQLLKLREFLERGKAEITPSKTFIPAMEETNYEGTYGGGGSEINGTAQTKRTKRNIRREMGRGMENESRSMGNESHGMGNERRRKKQKQGWTKTEIQSRSEEKESAEFLKKQPKEKKGRGSAADKNEDGWKSGEEHDGLAAAIQTQIPERETVRMALLAAVPAALTYVILQLQGFYLLTTEETVGIALLVAAVILLVLCLLERRKKRKQGNGRKRGKQKEEEIFTGFSDFSDFADYGDAQVDGYGEYEEDIPREPED